MKKIFIAVAIIAIGVIVYSCTKKDASTTVTDAKVLEQKFDPSKLDKMGLVSPDHGGGLDGDDGPEDPCWAHGGQLGVGVSWQIATCKSNCTSGIGFRCGHNAIVISNPMYVS